MEDNWTTVATFTWYQEALLLKMRLEASGIDCIIPEQFTSIINPASTGMTVRVLVKAAQLDEANSLLSIAPVEGTVPTCPECGSTKIETIGRGRTNIFRFLFGFLLFAPMRRKETKRCTQCQAYF
jgi:hypothetical protein